MPRVNRVRRHRKNAQYTKHHLWQFRHGHTYSHTFGEGYDFGDVSIGGAGREAFREGWNIFRDQVLADWIREDRYHDHGGPGTRPYAWWEFDAPERRLRIDGRPHPHDCPVRQAIVADRAKTHLPELVRKFNGLYYGRLAALIVPDDFEAVFESEAQYIDRLGLWLPGERDLYAAMLERETEPKERKLSIEDMGL